jgi:hypothetical protein
MKQSFFAFSLSLLLLFSACVEQPQPDLTASIVGTYVGVVSLNLDTDSLTDVPDQRLSITRIDDETIEINMLEYPSSSPVDTLTLTASLSPTPDGLVSTRGVSLKIAAVNYEFGTVEGTPYLTTAGGVTSDDGRFVEDTGELLFTLQILRNGVDHYELFTGIRQ